MELFSKNTEIIRGKKKTINQLHIVSETHIKHKDKERLNTREREER